MSSTDKYHFEVMLKVWVEGKTPNEGGVVNVVINLQKNTVIKSLVDQGYKVKKCEVVKP